MKDYSKMSDFEINKAIASSLGFKYIGRTWIDGADGIYHAVEKNDRMTELPNYCNNPSDAWPVILGNRISLCPDDMYEEAPHSGYWRADNEAGNHCHHEKPLRAAMIVYLMMKDEDK